MSPGLNSSSLSRWIHLSCFGVSNKHSNAFAKILNALTFKSFRPTLLASGLRQINSVSSHHAYGARIYGNPSLVVNQGERSEIEE
jgi:hypothetical protein